MEQRTSILRGTAIVSSLTLLSRLLGFVRDILVARLFGAGTFADAFFVAFRIPNLLRAIFAEGALTSAFVPVFSKELKRGDSHAQAALSSTASLLVFSTVSLSIIGAVFAPYIVTILAPGFSPIPEKFELCVLLTRIMLPYIVFVSLIALLNGVLNSVRIFGASALAQVVMNIVLIFGAWVAEYFDSRAAVIVLSISVIAGGIVQVLAQIPALRRSNFSLVLSRSLLSQPSRNVVKLMTPAIMGAAIYQLTIFLNTVMASLLQEGSVSWLFYADRITQLPIGIFSIALASVLLPSLSEAHVRNDQVTYASNLNNALRFTSFLIIPVSFGIIALAEPLVRILFERGQFSSFSTVQTAAAVQAYSLGLWGVSCHSMIVRGFAAREDTRTATIVGVFSLLATLVASLLLVGRFNVEHGILGQLLGSLQSTLLTFLPGWDLGHVGLALASSISSTLAFFILVSILGRGVSDFGEWRAAAIRSFLASSVMALGVSDFVRRFPGDDWVAVGSVPLGVIIYVLVSFLLKSPELRETFALMRRLIGRLHK